MSESINISLSSCRIYSMEIDNPFTRSRLLDFEMSGYSGFVEDLWYDHDAEAHGVVPMSADVQFPNLTKGRVIYKYQSRVRKEAKQRLKNAVAEILVKSGCEIQEIKAWIQREEKAVELSGYDVGRVPFAKRDIVHKGATKCLDNECISEHLYSIDLDTIYYDTSTTRRPVYKLAKTDMLNRNRFQLVIRVVFLGGSVSRDFVSAAFYCCTQPKQHIKKRTRTNLEEHQYPKDWYSPESRTKSVVDLLQAEKAVIGDLEVKGHFTSPNRKADIAYHFDMPDPKFQKSLEEGDVVGFHKNKDGEAFMAKLTQNNFHQVIQAGVISRSAFLEGNTPSEKTSITDKVCILGLVCVKVVGNIQTGERLYASSIYPGKATAESHWSHRSQDIFLGIAMESSDKCGEEIEHLVRCFVSFLFGITNKYCREKINELGSRTELQIEQLIKRRWKKMWQTFLGFWVFLAMFTFLICFTFLPGTSR